MSILQKSKSNDRWKHVVCQHYEYQNLIIDVSMLYVNTVRITKSNDTCRCKYVVCQHYEYQNLMMM